MPDTGGTVSELTLAGLRVVREIALCGSFTAAARALDYTQPAVSRQVAAVEAATGARLFVREARGVSLSAAGRVVVEHATRVLSGVEALERDLAALRDRLGGQVAVGAFPAACAVLVPRAVATVREAHPGLRVTLIEASTPVLLRQLRSGRLQVAVVGTGTGLPALDLDGVLHEVLSEGDLCVAVPDGHRLASASRVPVAELHGESWIVGRGSAGEPQFGAWPTLPDPVVGFAVRGWPARLGLVAAGLGICVLPELAAASIPSGVAVVRIDDPTWLGRRALVVTGTARSVGADAVVDALHRAARHVLGRHRPGEPDGTAELSSAESG